METRTDIPKKTSKIYQTPKQPLCECMHDETNNTNQPKTQIRNRRQIRNNPIVTTDTANPKTED